MNVSFNDTLVDLYDILAHQSVPLGGHNRPVHCRARHKVAIIIPYRDRELHLVKLLAHLHPILARQQIDYRVYVVEQAGADTFNKARILNVAFLTAVQREPTTACVIFHDVDLVPEHDHNLYTCPEMPRHMSVAIDEMNYRWWCLLAELRTECRTRSWSAACSPSAPSTSSR